MTIRGFEVGYSLESRRFLILWETQLDGAKAFFDTYVATDEWWAQSLNSVYHVCDARQPLVNVTSDRGIVVLTYFIAAPPDRGWQRNEGLLLLHSFLSLDIPVVLGNRTVADAEHV